MSNISVKRYEGLCLEEINEQNPEDSMGYPTVVMASDYDALEKKVKELEWFKSMWTLMQDIKRQGNDLTNILYLSNRRPTTEEILDALDRGLRECILTEKDVENALNTKERP